MKKQKLVKSVAGIIFVACWYAVFAIVGGLEQGTIDFIPCILAIVAVYSLIFLSGIISGAVTL